MRKISWVLQKNLINKITFDQVKQALVKDNISFEEVRIVPFSDTLPEIQDSDDFKIFYGTTTLILNAFNNSSYAEGIFYDKDIFSMKSYFEKWGEHMLNHDSEILTFGEILNKDYENGDWFVRPIYDYKSFSGRVMSFHEIKKFERGLAKSNNPYLNEDTLVVIANPKKISKEWRHFIVDKEVISTSRYIENGKFNKSSFDIPTGLLKYVKNRCEEFTPNDIFVMDTALHHNSYKIVECNCFNDTGFYEHNIEKIVSKINAHIKTKLHTTRN